MNKEGFLKRVSEIESKIDTRYSKEGLSTEEGFLKDAELIWYEYTVTAGAMSGRLDEREVRDSYKSLLEEIRNNDELTDEQKKSVLGGIEEYIKRIPEHEENRESDDKKRIELIKRFEEEVKNAMESSDILLRTKLENTNIPGFATKEELEYLLGEEIGNQEHDKSSGEER